MKWIKPFFAILPTMLLMNGLVFAQDTTFTVTSTGNVGIGTTNPQQKLHVMGVSRFNVRSDSYIDLSTPGGWPGIIAITPAGHRRDIIFDDDQAPGGGGIRLLTSSSSSPSGAANGITLDENGHVGIGTNFPDGNLDIDFGGTGSLVAGTPVGEGPGWLFFAPNGHRRDLNVFNGGMVFRVGTGTNAPPIRMIIGENGNVGIGMNNVPNNILAVAQGSSTNPIADAWTTYSSRRWKTNIKTLEGALDKVKRLRGVTFDWKANGKHDIGLIAEEVGAVIPEVVAYEKNGKDAKSVDYGRLVSVLIEAVKEQQQAIETLTARVADLEGDYHLTNR